MPVFGKLTGLLKAEYRERGYQLCEDEDFVYLINPAGKTTVFSYRVTMEDIEAHIKEEVK